MGNSSDFIKNANIVIDKSSVTMQQLFQTWVNSLGIDDKAQRKALISDLIAHEEKQPSPIGNGILIKAARLIDFEHTPKNVFVRLDKGISSQSFDKKDIGIAFMMFLSEKDGPSYLQVLAKAARILKDEDIQQKIMGAQNIDAIESIFYNTDLEQRAAWF